VCIELAGTQCGEHCERRASAVTQTKRPWLWTATPTPWTWAILIRPTMTDAISYTDNYINTAILLLFHQPTFFV